MNTSLLKKIQELYLTSGPLQAVEKVSAGYLSHNYILADDRKKYFLKQYTIPVDRIVGAHRVKQFFSEGGIPVILPLQALSNETYFLHEEKYYALFPFAEGKQYGNLEISRRALESAGKLLARIHLLSKDNVPHIVNPRYLGWDKEKFFQQAKEIEENISSRDKRTAFDVSALEMLRVQKGLVEGISEKYEDFSFGNPHILHGDYQEGNIFFDNNDNVLWVFDLEIANLGPRIFEVVRSMEIMCFNGYFDEAAFARSEVFLQAYDAVYPLGRALLADGIKAWYCNQVHTTWVLKEHYLLGNDRVDGFVEKYMRFFEYCSRNLESYANRLARMVQ